MASSNPFLEDDDDVINTKEKASTLYQKSSGSEKTMEEFIVLKLLGKGTFGKVYLVQHSENKNLYAMKSIRKDIVVDQEAI